MDTVAERNYKELKSKSYEVKFELSETAYDPIENIGSGAYGVVCSAVHRITKDKVAIKKISSIFEQSTIAKRTYREIKILKHFKHDNVISIRNIIRPKGPITDFKDVYIVFDLMESDLSRIIHSRQGLTNEHVQYFLYQIMRGLKYVHSANVLHRDLKPSNLFVNENCELKLGDFGMARGVSSAQDSYNYNMTQYVATRWYRAPELMLLPLEYTGAVDVWSVGCIFAEMLSRKHLFKGQNIVDQLKRIIDVLGVPSEEFLKFTRSHLLIKPFIKGLGANNAVPMETLFPQATSSARDLLSKMLVIDPRYRIGVEDALKHPYLSRYHDPLDEPVCVPVFDFQFEKQELTREKLKEVILHEIQEYEATTVTKKPVFDLRPVNKNKKPLSTAPATGLQAFLLQKQQQQKQQEQPVGRAEQDDMDTVKWQNIVDQLKRIIDVLGVPSEEFLKFTRSHLLIKPFIKGLGANNAVPMETLFPQATSSARDLLSKMLVIDPRYRIGVEDALKHPYLSRYHDPLDEPVCVPVFDFQFEKQELTREKLKEVILHEIQEYEATTVTKKPVFDLRPVNKNKKPLSTAPATGLQAFLLQKQQQQKQQEQPVGRAEQDDMDTVKCLKPLKFESSDVEMLSGKLLEMGLHETKANERELERVTLCAASPIVDLVSDVDMLSAKREDTAKQGLLTTTEVAVANESTEQNVLLDSKALIKAAILKGELRRKQAAADGSESKETSRTVTAVQRQREREEKRRKKMEKRQKKISRNRGNLKNEEPAIALTDEDRIMLARWENMQQQQNTSSAQQIPHFTATEQPVISSVLPSCLSHSSEPRNDADKTLVASRVPILSNVTASSCTGWLADGSTSQSSSSSSSWLPTYSEVMRGRHQTSFSDQSLDNCQSQLSMTGDVMSAMCDTDSTFSLLRHQLPQKQNVQTKPCFTNLSHNSPQLCSPNSLTKQIMKSSMDNLTSEHSLKGSADTIGSDIAGLLGNQENTSDSRLDSAPLSASLIADWLELSGNVDINDDALQRELEMSPTVMPNLLI